MDRLLERVNERLERRHPRQGTYYALAPWSLSSKGEGSQCPSAVIVVSAVLYQEMSVK